MNLLTVIKKTETIKEISDILENIESARSFVEKDINTMKKMYEGENVSDETDKYKNYRQKVDGDEYSHIQKNNYEKYYGKIEIGEEGKMYSTPEYIKFYNSLPYEEKQNFTEGYIKWYEKNNEKEFPSSHLKRKKQKNNDSHTEEKNIEKIMKDSEYWADNKRGRSLRKAASEHFKNKYGGGASVHVESYCREQGGKTTNVRSHTRSYPN